MVLPMKIMFDFLAPVTKRRTEFVHCQSWLIKLVKLKIFTHKSSFKTEHSLRMDSCSTATGYGIRYYKRRRRMRIVRIGRTWWRGQLKRTVTSVLKWCHTAFLMLIQDCFAGNSVNNSRRALIRSIAFSYTLSFFMNTWPLANLIEIMW